MYTNTKLLEISEKIVMVEEKGIKEQIEVDTVVLAFGTKSYKPLNNLDKTGIPFKAIGDADKIRTAFEAIHGGFNLNLS